MSHFRVVEVFESIQGEGAFVGTPSIFVRLFGCNLTCSGFGMPTGETSNERAEVAKKIEQYHTLSDLPLVKTGCDSYAAWDKNFKHLSELMTPEQLANKIKEILNGRSLGSNMHLVITGGEPLIKKWQRLYYELFIHLDIGFESDTVVTFETNGTQEVSTLIQTLVDHKVDPELCFSMSPKLSHSGEPMSKRFVPSAIRSMTDSWYKVFFKFVVSGESGVLDIEEIAQFASMVYPDQDKGDSSTLDWFDTLTSLNDVYLMPVGGCKEEYQQNAPGVAALAMKYGALYSPRLHIDVWGNSWGT
jgi:7-carboxy-7-deazaguanine synthase